MAATEISQVEPARSSNELAGAAANADGNWFTNSGQEMLVIEHTNGSGSDVTLTIVTQETVDDEAVGDKGITITKGKRYLIGYFPTAWYNDGNGRVQLTYSAVTDITVAVIKP